MADNLRVLAISGSTRANSSNLSLLQAIAELATDSFVLTIYNGLAGIPHFNPDLDNDHAPAEVTEFRNAVRESDGILICTPEYAMGVPGTLKNAIDWTVSSMEFSKKPVALITASLSGEKAHASLVGTLSVIEAEVADSIQLVISFIKTKVSEGGKITDEDTLTKVEAVIQSFTKLLSQKKGRHV